MTTYFISGHGDVTCKEFLEHYVPKIDFVLNNILNVHNDDYNMEDIDKFVVGDYKGLDSLAQLYIQAFCLGTGYIDSIVTVYHMFDEPRFIASPYFNSKGGYTTDEQRDAAMTKDSDKDIAWTRKGKEGSGTSRNIRRRIEFNGKQ